SGGKDEVRYFHFSLDELLEHAKTVEPGHLHIEEHQIGRMLFDQRKRLHAVFPLADQTDLRQSFQQIREFVARRLLIIDNDYANGHFGNRVSIGKRANAGNSSLRVHSLGAGIDLRPIGGVRYDAAGETYAMALRKA